MPKIFYILWDNHPEALQELVRYQRENFHTELTPPKKDDGKPVNIKVRHSSLDEIGKTLKEKSRQKRGKGW